MPHGGLPKATLDDTYRDLRTFAREACLLGRYCVIGGDFNTQLHVGVRGELLDELASEFEMIICNEHDNLDSANAWTFESALGHQRSIDYILVSGDLHVSDSMAINDLCMGSDHRAVKADIVLPLSKVPRAKNTKCKPVLTDMYADAVAEESSG